MAVGFAADKAALDARAGHVALQLRDRIRATRRVDTLDKAGTQPIDAAFIRGKIGAGESAVVDPGALSDHKWLGVKLILGGSAL